MTTREPSATQALRRPSLPLALPFPRPGPGLLNAYRQLDLAVNGTAAERKALGNVSLLPRPWDPATLTTPTLRGELWEWLEAVVTWLNTEHVWESTTVIPPCWPLHPHLVHETAVLADQRHQAGVACTSDALEAWHRAILPAFLERLKTKARTGCDERHQDWPARGRYARFTADHPRREEAFLLDREACVRPTQDGAQPRWRLVDGVLVDPATGEVP